MHCTSGVARHGGGDHRRAAEGRHRQDDAGRQHRRRLCARTRRVALLDIDPQKSLGRWHSLRRARLQQAATLAFSDISGWRLPAELERLKRDHDVVLIDSPPQLDTDARVAVRAADLVLVPIQPSLPDVWAAEGTLKLAGR